MELNDLPTEPVGKTKVFIDYTAEPPALILRQERQEVELACTDYYEVEWLKGIIVDLVVGAVEEE